MIPVKCQNCGNIWTSRAISASGVTNFSISNVSVGPCPQCGGYGRAVEGTFNADAVGNFTIVKAPIETWEVFRHLARTLRHKDVSREQVAELAEVAKAASSGALAPAQAETAAASINSRFSGLFSERTAAWLAILLPVYLWLLTERGSDVDHAEVMAELRRQGAVAEETVSLNKEMLAELRRIVDLQTPVEPQRIVAPPPGPRSKRQARRDRRFAN